MDTAGQLLTRSRAAIARFEKAHQTAILPNWPRRARPKTFALFVLSRCGDGHAKERRRSMPPGLIFAPRNIRPRNSSVPPKSANKDKRVLRFPRGCRDTDAIAF
jgi:hypothetical protein